MLIIHWLKVILTIVLALLITLIPVPYGLQAYMPQLCLLVLLAWCYYAPNLVNVGVAWVIGLVLDTLYGTPLGMHAFGLVLVIYVFLCFHARIYMFHRLQQSLIIGCFALLNSLMLLGLAALFSHDHAAVSNYLWQLCSVVMTAILWPLVLRLVVCLAKSQHGQQWGDE